MLYINLTSAFLWQLFPATHVATLGSCRMASSRAPLLTSGIRSATVAARASFWKATPCFHVWPHPQARLLGTSPCPTAEVSASYVRETWEEFRTCLYQLGTLMFISKGGARSHLSWLWGSRGTRCVDTCHGVVVWADALSVLSHRTDTSSNFQTLYYWMNTSEWVAHQCLEATYYLFLILFSHWMHINAHISFCTSSYLKHLCTHDTHLVLVCHQVYIRSKYYGIFVPFWKGCTFKSSFNKK